MEFLNFGASFSTQDAARAFAAAISVTYKVKDIEPHLKPNKFGIYHVWYMIEAETHANKSEELNALIMACEDMYK